MASPALRLRQFVALIRKNATLQLRDRRSFLGLSGYAGALASTLLPAAFFLLMWLPRYYIQPYTHPQLLNAQDYDIDTKWWAGASPYEGPALTRGGDARVAVVPNTPEVAALAARLAMALACPDDPLKRHCSPSSITTFGCLFGAGSAPPECENTTECMSNPVCYTPALSKHLILLRDENELFEYLTNHPHELDAAIVFPHAQAAAAACRPGVTNSACGDTASLLLPPGIAGDGSSGVLTYALRFNSSDVPPTALTRDIFDVSPGAMPLPGNLLWTWRRYWFFVNLQLALDRALLGGHIGHGTAPAPLRVRVKPFPWPSREEDMGAASAGALLTLLLVFAFLSPTRAVIGDIVRERELRLREGMRVLGLTDAAYWCSWALTHWLSLGTAGSLCAAVGLYPFGRSSLVLMLAFYWALAAALVAWAYALTPLLPSTRVAGSAAQLAYVAAMLPGFLLPALRPFGGLSWHLACLSPPSAASLFAAALVNWERAAAGLTPATLWLPVTPAGGFSAGSALLALLLDVLLYGLLAWYLDKVVPSDQGQTLPLYFPLLPTYWRTTPSAASFTHSLVSTPAPDVVQSQTHVELHGLRRVFDTPGGGKRVAVEGLSLSMPAGRVTALLGPNGAGKTTTVHMLTGMLQPTGGSASIGGADICKDMPAIRRSLGVCPQYDILWPALTVQEHLCLAGAFKGLASRPAVAEAARAAHEVGLSDKLHCLAGELSGGQRRKLSVAMALLGDPAVIFLDEPTSGMDPRSRRTIWDMIKRRRGSCVIVLTTHSMPEADLLADDIHILAGGRLVASGTPHELKSTYGSGYTLTVVLKTAAEQHRQEQKRQQQHLGSSNTPAVAATECSEPAEMLLALARHHVPHAVLRGVAGGEVVLMLPRAGAPGFPGLLRDLDARGVELGVASYGLSVTTLEEVFLAVSDEAEALTEQQQQQAANSSDDNVNAEVFVAADVAGAAAAADDDVHGAAAPRLAGSRLYMQQFWGLLAKRALCARRDRLALVTQLVVPLLLVLLALSTSGLQAPARAQQPLDMSRDSCLMGAPALLSAGPSLREQPEFRGFLDGYPRAHVIDTGLTQLYRGPGGPPLPWTLEGHLLEHWDSGTPSYDALHVSELPPLEALLSGTGAGPSLTLLVNQSAIAALPAALNQATTALLRLVTAAGGGRGGADALHDSPAPQAVLPSITASSAPLPIMPGETAEHVRQDAGALMLVLCLTLAGSMLSASVVVHLVREAQSGSKYLQLMSGAPVTAFWLANAAWDGVAFVAVAIGMLVLVAWRGPQQLAGPRLAALAALLAVFGPAAICLAYVAHFAFSDELRALQRLSSSCFLVGYLGFTTTWLLDLLARATGRPALATAALRTRAALRALSPHYVLAQGVYDVAGTYQGQGELPFPGPSHTPRSPFTYQVLGVALVHLLVQALLCAAATLLLDSGLMRQLLPVWRALCTAGSCTSSSSSAEQAHTHGLIEPLLCSAQRAEEGTLAAAPADVAAADSTVDADVAAERAAVQAGEGLRDAMVVLLGLTKTYAAAPGEPRLRAVDGLWLRIRRGECFGLLGVNGAGKTTTLQLLTGLELPDAGDALVGGASVTRELRKARHGMLLWVGALPGSMTGREVLLMYGRLRGIAGDAAADRAATRLLRALGLSRHADVVCGAYSGGMARRLSVAVAVVGYPDLVILDEPSTGLDPTARRLLWRVLQGEVLAVGRTVLLTSHSMEEIEALAGRLAILTAGRIACLGTPQHLKSRFGDGYTLHVRLRADAGSTQHQPPEAGPGRSGSAGGDAVAQLAAATAVAERRLLSALPGAVVLEREPGRLLLRLLPAPASHAVQQPEQQDEGRRGSGCGWSLADAFEALEGCCYIRGSGEDEAAAGGAGGKLDVAEYCFSQGGLERVFLSLTASAGRRGVGASCTDGGSDSGG